MDKVNTGSIKPANKINIGRVINSGRYGTVYQANGVHRGQSKEFAVKLLPVHRHDVDNDQDNMLNIRSEIINMWRCRGHRNIVRLHNAYLEDGNYHLVEDFCGGDSMQEVLGKQHTENAVINMINDVANGLAYVHSKDILFLDVKPQNIVRSNSDMAFKLTDFGSSRRLTQGCDSVHHSQVLCTPLFASPELILQNDQINHQHDAWALGIILFWLSAGRHPFIEFDTRSPQEILRRIVHDPVPIHEVPPGPLRDLVRNLLTKDPSNRMTVSNLVNILRLF